jgi:L-aminopeptidase/D-esterase-like protein
MQIDPNGDSIERMQVIRILDRSTRSQPRFAYNPSMTKAWNLETALRSSITIVDGVRVGHSTDTQRSTGCTAIVCDQDSVAGIDVRGGATASHEIELLNPTGLVDQVQAIMLTGGSAMGLASTTGASNYMREAGRGFKTNQGAVPIIPAAALYDLGIGDHEAHPSAESGYEACTNASTDFERGNVGAGCGAVVGKVFGHANATKSGLGSAGWETDDGLKVGALVALNAFGDVLHPETGSIIAGARNDDDLPLNTRQSILMGNREPIMFGSNTTLCVVATNAKLDKTQACIVSRIAQSGLSRVVTPCHTQYDGDMVFTLSNGDQVYDINRIGILASMLIEAAICDAIYQATSAHSIPSASELGWIGDSHPQGQS